MTIAVLRVIPGATKSCSDFKDFNGGEVMMVVKKGILTGLGLALVLGTVSCANLSQPVTEREKTAAIGGLAGGATGALIGSFAGSAVAGGLFGIPLGAVAGWYVGDQYDIAMKRDRERAQERDSELDRLRRENERLRRENDDIRRPSAQAPAASSAQPQARVEQSPVQEQELRQPQTAQQAQQMRQEQQARTTQREQPRRQASVSRSSSQDIREAQRALNKMGFDAGSVDGVWGPNTAAAIRNFQQSRGIEATGRLNDRTMEELGIQGGQQAQQNR
jgi:hypothetical protein